MFRKTVLAIAATAALGVAALAPTTASAYHNGWNHRSHNPGFSFRFYTPGHYAYAPRCYIKRQRVHTHWGWRWRSVRVCR